MKKWIIRGSLILAFTVVVAGFIGWGLFEALKRGLIAYNEYDIRSEGILSVGDLAPDLELESLDGGLRKLSEFYEEKPLVLVFGSYT